MELKHISPPEFGRERGEVIKSILRRAWETSVSDNVHWSGLQRAYNEGYKQALRDWYYGFNSKEWVGCVRPSVEEIIEEVDKIDKET